MNNSKLEVSKYFQKHKNNEVSETHNSKLDEDILSSRTHLIDTSSDNDDKPRKISNVEILNSQEISNNTPINMSEEKVSDSEISSDMKNMAPVKNKNLGSRKKAKRSSLNPLDEQILLLKRKANSILENNILIVRVGYKYKCFAEDAFLISNILKIMLLPGEQNFIFDNDNTKCRRFSYCSFSDTRLAINIERLLVAKNLNIIIVEQESNETNQPGNIISRYIDKIATRSNFNILFETSSSNALFLNSSIWSMKEHNGRIYILSINLTSNNYIVHETVDLNSQDDLLGNLLRYLDPSHIICQQGNISDDLISHFKKENGNDRDNIIMVNFLKESIYLGEANSHRPDISDDASNDISNLDKTSDITGLSEPFSELRRMLEQFINTFSYSTVAGCNLGKFILTPFKEGDKYITLDFKTAHSLDLEKLLDLLNFTRTNYGFKNLKFWLFHPLIDLSLINERLESVEFLRTNSNSLFFDHLNNSYLRNHNNLLLNLNKISFGSITKRDFYFFIKSFIILKEHFQKHSRYLTSNILGSNAHNLTPNLIRNIFTSINQSLNLVDFGDILSIFNISAILDKSKETRLMQFFNFEKLPTSAVFNNLIKKINEIDYEIGSELLSIKSLLNKPYLKIDSTNNYLIELKNSDLARQSFVEKIPSNWVKCNSTKLISRFQSPKILQLQIALDFEKKNIINLLQIEFSKYMKDFNSKYFTILMPIIENLAIYDSLLSLAAFSSNLYFNKPELHSNLQGDFQFIYAKNARNPIIESLDGINYIPNDISINSKSKFHIITGPNMAGKSTYIRQVAILTILAQIGSYVPAQFYKATIFHSIRTRIGGADDILNDKSTFKYELLEIKDILDKFNKKSLILLDEVGRGTSTIDGKAISSALIDYFIDDKENCPFIFFTTHYPPEEISNDYCKKYYMDYIEEIKKGQSWKSVTFLYKLKSGISNDAFGFHVSKLSRIDNSVIDRAVEISRNESNSKVDFSLISSITKIIKDNSLSSNEKVKILSGLIV